MKKLILVGVLALAAGGALQIKVDGGVVAAATTAPSPPGMDLSTFPDAPPARPVPLVFIHHSCGGQMLAPAGPEAEVEGAKCIYDAHPNGGGLRPLLEKAGYTVNEASYGSEVGDKTDLFDWLPKFQQKMDKILRVQRNDTLLPEGSKNEIVVFKSCYTESELTAQGSPPGNPAGPELTLENAKATLTALLPEFQKRPDTLFVYVTSPPQAGYVDPVPAWTYLLRKVLGRPGEKERKAERARLARELWGWVRAADGWLAGYPQKNVVVFDYYDVLTDQGASNLSRYPTLDGKDSHPAAEGNRKAAEAFVPFLNRAVRRFGLSGV